MPVIQVSGMMRIIPLGTCTDARAERPGQLEKLSIDPKTFDLQS